MINFAAESHVDRSIADPLAFAKTNILGTMVLLNAFKTLWLNNWESKRFYHISTDEVYGSLGETGLFEETTPYHPNSPYSASKASSDHFVRAVAEDPARKGLIYAGTEFGAFVSFNDGKSWNSLQMNLPNVPITDMEVTQNDLAISTQGRGFWILDKINVLQSTHEVNDKPHLFNPEEALRTNLGGGRRSGGLSFENDISFYLPKDYKIEEVDLYIKDLSLIHI